MKVLRTTDSVLRTVDNKLLQLDTSTSGGISTVETFASIVGDGTLGTPIQLAGDQVSPGSLKYYGTNQGGAKGFYTLPSYIPYSGSTGDVNLGEHSISANLLVSTAITTSPLLISSSELVSNLNVDLLDNFHGSYYLDYDNFVNIPEGIVSGSDQILGLGFITSSNGGNASLLEGQPGSYYLAYSNLTGVPIGIVSGSDQILGLGFITSSDGGNADLLDGFHGSYYLNYSNFTNIPSGIVSSSQQISNLGFITSPDGGNADLLDGFHGSYYLDYTNFVNIPGGIISSSQQIANHGFITSPDGGNADLLDGFHGTYYLDYTNFSNVPSGIISSSLQISNLGFITSPDGGNASLLQGYPGSFYLDYPNLTNIPLGIISSSQQIADLGFLTEIEGGNADTLDGYNGTYYLDYNNFTNVPTIGNGTLTMGVSGNGLTGTATFTANQTGGSVFTVNSNATPNNVANTLVFRDNIGNFSGYLITGSRFISTVATGSAPFSVNSSTLVEGLNVDMLDGNHGSYYYPASNPSGYTTNAGTVTSIAVTADTGISVTGSPITDSGIITITNTAPHIGTDLTFSGIVSPFTLNSSTGTDVTFTAGTGIGLATTSGNLTITNSAPDQTVVLTPSTGISITGTYPSFTITNSAPHIATNISQGTRTATTVPVLSSTGTDATLEAATTALAGVMSAADKSKLDGIAAEATANTGTVTSVGLTTPTGLTVTGSPITVSGSLNIAFTSGYSIPTTASQTNWNTAYGWGNHAGLYAPISHSLGSHTNVAIGVDSGQITGQLLRWSGTAWDKWSPTYEQGLGVPSVSGYLLSSTTAGVRSWVAPYSHPSYTLRSVTATAGQVISTFSSDSSGHVTGITLRSLGESDIPALSISKITGLTAALSNKIETSTIGQAGGVAPLDSNAKIATSYLPDSILGQVSYIGNWNASTNTPTLPTASTVKGDYYIVTVAGTYGGIDFQIGDWVISDGVSWTKVDNSDAVTSVFGRIGNVVANAGDYSSFYVRYDAVQTLNTTQQTQARTNIDAAKTAHTHLWSNITDPPPTYAPSSHSHEWADIIDPPSEFAPAAHTLGFHSNVAIGVDSGQVTGQLIRWSGTAWDKWTPDYMTTAHTASSITSADIINWNTAYSNRITSLTTTGSSGAATLVSNVLNIPAYTLAGLGGQPLITAGTNLQYWRGDKTWQTLNTAAVSESGNLYYTNARGIGSTLTGYTATSGTISSTDTILTAIQKLGYDKHIHSNIAILNGTQESFTTVLKDKLDGIAAGATANTGTVTSVAATAGTGISVTGSPITTSGTLTITNTAPHVGTNLSFTGTVSPFTLNSSTGTDVTFTAGTGIGLAATSGNLTITNSAPDQTVVLSNGTGISVTGTYPSFTITNSAPHIATNISQGTRTATTVPVLSSTGTDATLEAATTALAGVMSAADKSKLDGIAAGAQVNVATDLTFSGAASPYTLNSSTGTDVTFTAGTGVSLSATSSNITINNSAPDQTVSIGSGTGISVTGTYPSFTVANTAPNVSTNLTFTGTTSPVTLNSSDGTDVTFTAGTGISLSASGTNLTITNSVTDTNTYPTAFAWSNGTTSGPTGSLTGTSPTVSFPAIPSATDSISGVVTTTTQTFSGQKQLNGKLIVFYNSGTTGSTPPAFTAGMLELYTTNGNVPTLAFHRSGISATALYEYDGELHVNAWTARSQTGKLLSTGNTYFGTDATGYRPLTVNGVTENVSTSDHTHSYLPLSGGTLTGDLLFSNSGTTTRQIRFNPGDNDYARIAAGATAPNTGWLEIATADDGTEPIYVRQYSGTFITPVRTLTLLDGNGNSSFPGSVTGVEMYAANWFRNTASGTGIYNENLGSHFYAQDNSGWCMATPNTDLGKLTMRVGHTGTIKGSLYWDSSGVGLLNDQGGWSVRANYGTGYGGLLNGAWNVDVATSSEKLTVNGNIAFGTNGSACKIVHNTTTNSIDFIIV